MVPGGVRSIATIVKNGGGLVICVAKGDETAPVRQVTFLFVIEETTDCAVLISIVI